MAAAPGTSCACGTWCCAINRWPSFKIASARTPAAPGVARSCLLVHLLVLCHVQMGELNLAQKNRDYARYLTNLATRMQAPHIPAFCDQQGCCSLPHGLTVKPACMCPCLDSHGIGCCSQWSPGWPAHFWDPPPTTPLLLAIQMNFPIIDRGREGGWLPNWLDMRQGVPRCSPCPRSVARNLQAPHHTPSVDLPFLTLGSNKGRHLALGAAPSTSYGGAQRFLTCPGTTHLVPPPPCRPVRTAAHDLNEFIVMT